MSKDTAQLIQSTGFSSADLPDANAYTALNSGLPYACYEVRILNASTKDIMISTDGTNLYEYVPAGDIRYLQGQQAAGPGNYKCNWAKGTIFYGAGTAGTGDIYIFGSYQANS